VGTVNPARRELRVKPASAHDHQFNQLRRLWLVPQDGSAVACAVQSLHRTKDYVRVVLGPGTPRDFVEKVKGAVVSISVDDVVPRPDGMYSVDLLEGMTVQDGDGVSLGRVCATYSSGGHDVAEVDVGDGGLFHFPLVPEAVVEVDLDRALITVGDLTPFRVDNAD
jgi:ribosomal 30S subunit maturation factor RimM